MGTLAWSVAAGHLAFSGTTKEYRMPYLGIINLEYKLLPQQCDSRRAGLEHSEPGLWAPPPNLQSPRAGCQRARAARSDRPGPSDSRAGGHKAPRTRIRIGCPRRIPLADAPHRTAAVSSLLWSTRRGGCVVEVLREEQQRAASRDSRLSKMTAQRVLRTDQMKNNADDKGSS